MITVISAWYNEEFLAPYFLRHYSFADKIVILLDKSTNDNTRAIVDYRMDVASNVNVQTRVVCYPDGFDDKKKIQYLNEVYHETKTGYILNVDADEFILFPRDEKFDYDIARVDFANVYRHHTDYDLDRELPVGSQRRHGVKKWPYLKPVIARAGVIDSWNVGAHSVVVNGKREEYHSDGKESGVIYRTPDLPGAHWANADPCFCVKRRMNFSSRQSVNNIRRGYTTHNHNLTEEDIRSECARHASDPLILEDEYGKRFDG